MKAGLGGTVGRSLVCWRLLTWLCTGVLASPSVVAGSDVLEVVSKVSVDSYTGYLQNDLGAHDGQNRYADPGHASAQQKIQERFQGLGLRTSLESGVYGGVAYTNVVGVLPGVIRPDDIYLVGAHYDSVNNAPGAWDNASGVAAVLEAARVLSQYRFEATLVFLAFDREEQWMIGSSGYVRDHAWDRMRGMINIESIAYRPFSPSQSEYRWAWINYTVRTATVDELAAAMALYAGLTCGSGSSNRSDHMPFSRQGFAAAWLISLAVPPQVHTPQDSLDLPGYIDCAYGATMTRGVVGYLATQAGLAPVRLSPDFNGDRKVDGQDLTLLLDHWGGNDPAFDIAPPPAGDGLVDIQDQEGLLHYWHRELPEPGLLVHWGLDETDGNVAEDSLGGYTAQLEGHPLWRPAGGIRAGAIELDGVDDSLATNLVLNPNQLSFSVRAWVKGGAPGQVICCEEGGTNWLLAGAEDGALTTEFKSVGRMGKPLSCPAVITDGDWHEVGLIWDGASRILFVDGVQCARDTPPNVAGVGGRLNIGVGKDRRPGSFWSGLIDDVRVYNRAVQP